MHELVTIDTDFIDARFNYETVFKILSECFKQNLLSLNFTKTQFTNFTTKIITKLK